MAVVAVDARGGGFGGGRRGGGFGGGGGGFGGGGGAGARGNPDDMRRMRDAMQEITRGAGSDDDHAERVDGDHHNRRRPDDTAFD